MSRIALYAQTQYADSYGARNNTHALTFTLYEQGAADTKKKKKKIGLQKKNDEIAEAK